jgi:endonuclease III
LTAQLPGDIDSLRVAMTFLRHHAQHTCIAVGPHCGVCPLREACVAGHAHLAEAAAGASGGV